MHRVVSFHNDLIRPCICEFLGSAVFSFLFSFGGQLPLNSLNFGIVAGLSLLSAQTIVLQISGAHFNPGISLAHCIHRRISGIQCFSYICVQLFGCFIGSATHFLLVSTSVFEDTYVPHEVVAENGEEKISRLQAFLLETILLAILCVVHLRQAQEDFEHPHIVPSVWALISYICAPFIGTACNVALSLSTLIIHSIFLAQMPVPSAFYLPLLATILGSFIASLIIYSCREVSTPPSPCDPSS